MANHTVPSSAANRSEAPALAFALALGAAVGVAFGSTFLPWDLVAGSGTFWQSAESDRAAALIGYMYYVADEWRLPVGAIATLNLPDGGNIVFTDSIPILALPMKVLHTLGLPAWNYFGAWLLCCYALNGAAVTLVLWTAGIRSGAVMAVAALLAADMPVLLHRWYQSSLCGQFVILLTLACYVAVGRARRPQTVLTVAGVLVIASIMVMPYLGAMVMGLYAATLVRAACRGVPTRHLVSNFALMCVALAATLIALGYVSFDGPRLAAGGFGHFSTNVLSPFASSLSGLNPDSWRRLRAAEAAGSAWPFYDRAWPDASGGQYFEGFGYLGIGLLLLCALHAPYVARNGADIARRHWPLLGVLVAAVLFALSNKVYLGYQRIVEIPLPYLLYGLAGVFRSSGRFFWLAAYAVLASVTVLTVRRFGAAKGAALIALAAALQMLDTTPLRRAINLDARSTHTAGLYFDAWKPWLSDLERLFIVPSFGCGNPNLGNRKLSLQYYAARVGPIPTNSAYTSRDRPNCGDELGRLQRLAAGRRVGWVFFADGHERPEIAQFRGSPGIRCRTIDGLDACEQDAR